MFCVIYQWKVKPGKEDVFRDTWREITEAIFEQHGSFGSRMHRADDGSWIAYAQWPDRKHWENHADTLGIEIARERQMECLRETPSILAFLTVTDDLLKPESFKNDPGNSEAPSKNSAPKMRVARPTDRLDEVVKFYRDGLGLSELGGFKDHDGFDGVMLGHSDILYHFEFSHCHGHDSGRAPTKDNLIVFYLPDRSKWQEAIDRMKSHDYQPVPSFNPYWDKQGQTFEDPDGYRVVLQNADWPASDFRHQV